MQNCKNINKMMSLYIDNMLDDKNLKKFNAHIKECDNCAFQLNKMQETVLTVSSLKSSVNDDFLPQLRTKLVLENQNENNKVFNKAFNLKSLSVAMAAVLVILISKNTFYNIDNPPSHLEPSNSQNIQMYDDQKTKEAKKSVETAEIEKENIQTAHKDNNKSYTNSRENQPAKNNTEKPSPEISAHENYDVPQTASKQNNNASSEESLRSFEIVENDKEQVNKSRAVDEPHHYGNENSDYADGHKTLQNDDNIYTFFAEDNSMMSMAIDDLTIDINIKGEINDILDFINLNYLQNLVHNEDSTIYLNFTKDEYQLFLNDLSNKGFEFDKPQEAIESETVNVNLNLTN